MQIRFFVWIIYVPSEQYKKYDNAGIHEADISENLYVSRNSTNKTPKDFIMPGTNRLMSVAPNSTNQPHPPSGGTSS